MYRTVGLPERVSQIYRSVMYTIRYSANLCKVALRPFELGESSISDVDPNPVDPGKKKW